MRRIHWRQKGRGLLRYKRDILKGLALQPISLLYYGSGRGSGVVFLKCSSQSTTNPIMIIDNSYRFIYRPRALMRPRAS